MIAYQISELLKIEQTYLDPYVYTAIDYDNVNYNDIVQTYTNRDIQSDSNSIRFRKSK